jgi:hypothetical protein
MLVMCLTTFPPQSDLMAMFKEEGQSNILRQMRDAVLFIHRKYRVSNSQMNIQCF